MPNVFLLVLILLYAQKQKLDEILGSNISATVKAENSEAEKKSVQAIINA